jgi:hypothetical protein
MMHRLVIGSVVIAALLLPGGLFADDECKADIRGTLMRKEESTEKKTYTIKLDIESKQSCAVVRFDVVVVEVESGGKEHVVRLHKQVKIRDSVPATMKFDYTHKKGRTIASHRFEQTSCEICD